MKNSMGKFRRFYPLRSKGDREKLPLECEGNKWTHPNWSFYAEHWMF